MTKKIIYKEDSKFATIEFTIDNVNFNRRCINVTNGEIISISQPGCTTSHSIENPDWSFVEDTLDLICKYSIEDFFEICEQLNIKSMAAKLARECFKKKNLDQALRVLL